MPASPRFVKGLLLLGALVAVGSFGSAARAQLELPQVLAIDVPSATLAGSFLIDGVIAPPDYGEQALIHLVSADDALPITLGVTNTQVYGPRMVVAGDYRPAYELLFSDGALPENPITAVGDVAPLVGVLGLDVDVPTIEVTFTFHMDGVDPPAVPGETGRIWLRDVSSGLELPVASTYVGGDTIRVIPGVYDVVYRHQSGVTVPQNENAVLIPALALSTPQTVAVDVPTRSQTLSFLLNGAPFPASTYADGEIVLRNHATGDAVSFGMTSDGSATRVVVPGVYDVTYGRDGLSDLVPANAGAVVAKSIALDADGGGFPLIGEVDVQAAAITLEATLNGAPDFPASLYERGEIVLVSASGDEAPIGTTDDPSPDPVLVVKGKYDVHYRHLSGNLIVPRNPDAIVATSLGVGSDAVLPIDVPAIELVPDFTLDGEPFPSSQYERGDFVLRGRLDTDEFVVGSSHDPPSSVIVVPGRYDVVWDWQTGNLIVPRNLDHDVVRGVDLLFSQPLAVDVPTRMVAPTFTLDAVAFPTDPGESGRFVLRPVHGGGGIDIGLSSQVVPDFVRVIRDIYAIEYHWVAGLDVPANPARTIGFSNVPEPGLGAGWAAGSVLLLRLARRRRRQRGQA